MKKKIDDPTIISNAQESFRNFLFTLCNPPLEEWEYYKSQMSLWQYQQGDFFLKPGDEPNIYGFLYSGLSKRYYFSPEGEPIVFSFDKKGSVVSDLPAILSETPAKLHVEFLQESLVLVTPPDFYREIRERHKSWNDSARKITEIKYLESVERTLDLLCLKAVDRYQKFADRNKEILPYIEKRDIAAYIGVTPNSLSRILRSLKSNSKQQAIIQATSNI